MRFAGSNYSCYNCLVISYSLQLLYCRLEKDSSNDADMFEDSSGEDCQTTCGLEDGDETSKVLHSKAPEEASAASVDQFTNDSVSIYDDGEKSLIEMTDEERDYFQRYKEGLNFSITFQSQLFLTILLFNSKPSSVNILEMHHLFLPALYCQS